MLLSDGELIDRYHKDLAIGRKPMIEPFEPDQVKVVKLDDGQDYEVISYGTTSYGYDIRVGTQFKVFTNTYGATIDPKNLSNKCFVDVEGALGRPIIIPPNSFALCHSYEWVRVPRDCLVTITGKSTYARAAQVVPVTPLEPEWEGQITIEISNTAPLPVKIYPMEGIMQLNFHMGSRWCKTSYKDRQGKYMHQRGITLPKV